MEARHLTRPRLDAGLAAILQSPADDGELCMIVRRPDIGARECLEVGELSVEEGLVGDNWSTRGRRQTPPRPPNPQAQVTLMNARVADLVAGGYRRRWALAGDQLFVDLDLSLDNLPPGTRLRLGGAVLEVTSEPHTGCRKFVERFGLAAMEFVNSEPGRRACLRGVNTRVVQAGTIRVGDHLARTLVSRVTPSRGRVA